MSKKAELALHYVGVTLKEELKGFKEVSKQFDDVWSFDWQEWKQQMVKSVWMFDFARNAVHY